MCLCIPETPSPRSISRGSKRLNIFVMVNTPPDRKEVLKEVEFLILSILVDRKRRKHRKYAKRR